MAYVLCMLIIMSIHACMCIYMYRLPRWLSHKESTCQYRRHGLDPGSWRPSGEGNGNPLQYSEYKSIHTHTHIMYVVAVLVTKSCLTLCHYMDYSPPFSSVHGIIQARILEWVAISFSRGSSWPRDRTCLSCKFLLYCRQILYHQATPIWW